MSQVSPTQPDLSPGSPSPAAANDKKKRKQLDVVAEESSSNDDADASRPPFTQRASNKGGPGPLTRKFYTREEIDAELVSIHEHLQQLNKHIENLEAFLKLH